MSITIENVFQYSEDELDKYLQDQGDFKNYLSINEKRYMTVYYLRKNGNLQEDSYTQDYNFTNYIQTSGTFDDFENNYIPGKYFLEMCDYGNIKVVKKYLEKYDNNKLLKYRDRLGRTALMIVSKNGYTEIVKLLLVTGEGHPEYQDNIDNTALIYASSNGHTEIVKLLLATGQSHPEYRDKHGYTALMFASMNGHDEIVEYLLATNQSLPEYKNNFDETASNLAYRRGHSRIAKFIDEYNPFMHEGKFAAKRK